MSIPDFLRGDSGEQNLVPQQLCGQRPVSPLLSERVPLMMEKSEIISKLLYNLNGGVKVEALFALPILGGGGLM